jgi:hypothetical protein
MRQNWLSNRLFKSFDDIRGKGPLSTEDIPNAPWGR